MVDNLPKSTGPATIAEYLNRRSAFAIDAVLIGSPAPPRSTGRLPQPWIADVSNAAYVVYSHGTPIAWRDQAGVWVIPKQRYSPATSVHQCRIALAIKIAVYGQPRL